MNYKIRGKDLHDFNNRTFSLPSPTKRFNFKIWIRKCSVGFVGLLIILKCLGPNQFILPFLDGIIYPFLIEETRLRPAVVRTITGNVTILSELKYAMISGFKIRN